MDKRKVLLEELSVSHSKMIDSFYSEGYDNCRLLQFCSLYVAFVRQLNPQCGSKRFDYVFTSLPNLNKKDVLNAHLFTASEYAQSIITRIEKDPSLNLKNELTGVIFDYPRLLEAVENVYGIPFGKFAGERNMRVDSYTSYKVAAQLYWGMKPPQRSNTLNAYSIFAIRQAIELAGKEILGLENILNKDGSVFKHGTRLPWDFIIRDSARSHLTLSFNATEIHKIYKWTNNFVHTGQNGLCYAIALALVTAKKMYEKKSIEDRLGRETFWNANEIRGYRRLKQNFEYYLSNRFRENPKTAKWSTTPSLAKVID